MPQPQSQNRLSLDTWAVLLALAVALVVRIGIVREIPW
jgi:hypothetical protein